MRKPAPPLGHDAGRAQEVRDLAVDEAAREGEDARHGPVNRRTWRPEPGEAREDEAERGDRSEADEQPHSKAQ